MATAKALARLRQQEAAFIGPDMSFALEDLDHRYGWQGSTSHRNLLSGIYVAEGGNYPSGITPTIWATCGGAIMPVTCTPVMENGKIVRVDTEGEYDSPGDVIAPTIQLNWGDAHIEAYYGNDYVKFLQSITITYEGANLPGPEAISYTFPPNPVAGKYAVVLDVGITLVFTVVDGKLTAVSAVPLEGETTPPDGLLGVCRANNPGETDYVDVTCVLSVPAVDSDMPVIHIDPPDDELSSPYYGATLLPKSSAQVNMVRSDHRVKLDDPTNMFWHRDLDPLDQIDLDLVRFGTFGSSLDELIVIASNTARIILEAIVPYANGGAGADQFPPNGTNVWICRDRTLNATINHPMYGLGEPGYYSERGIMEIVIASGGTYTANAELDVVFSGGGGVTRAAVAKAYTDSAGHIYFVRLVDQGQGYTAVPSVSVAGGSVAAELTASIADSDTYVFRMYNWQDHGIVEGSSIQATWRYGDWSQYAYMLPCGRYEMTVVKAANGCVSVSGGLTGPALWVSYNSDGDYESGGAENWPAGYPWPFPESDPNDPSSDTYPISLCQGSVVYDVAGIRDAGTEQCVFKERTKPDFIDTYFNNVAPSEWFAIPAALNSKVQVS